MRSLVWLPVRLRPPKVLRTVQPPISLDAPVVWPRSADAIPLSSAHVDRDGLSLSGACSEGAFLEPAAWAGVADSSAGAELLLAPPLPTEDWAHVRRVAMTAARDMSIATPAIRLG